MTNIVIATTKEWNIREYFRLKKMYKDKYLFHLITHPEELTEEYLDQISPKYVFFPHWSWIIKEEIYQKYECIVFHMTDLPFGRGGSPLQNLILRGIYETKISAIRVEKGLDTGPIYLKEPCDISLGSAEEIYMKVSEKIFRKIIPEILEKKPMPKPQVGKATVFKRRKPSESNLLELDNPSMQKMYDFIRMLDAEGYPKAFLKFKNLKIEFSHVHMYDKKLSGRFEIVEVGENE